MYKATIVSTKKETLQEDGSEFLEVGFEVHDGEGNLIDLKRRGFPLDTELEVIKAEIAKTVAVMEDDARIASENAERNQIHAKADATIEALNGLEITPDDVEEDAEPGN
jgi:hypothetical protein